MNAALDPRGHRAVVEPHGDDEDGIQWQAVGAVQGVTQLGVELPALADRVAGKTGDEEIADLDGLLDGARPVLSRQQLAGVQPRIETLCAQFLVEPQGGPAVFHNVGDEDLGMMARQELESTAVRVAEQAQSVDLDRPAFLEAAAQDAGHPLVNSWHGRDSSPCGAGRSGS